MARLTAYRVLRRVDEDEAFSHLALSGELDSSGLDARDKDGA